MGKRKKRRKEGEKGRGEKRGEGERREKEEWREDKMSNNSTSWKGLSGTSVFYVWMKTDGSC